MIPHRSVCSWMQMRLGMCALHLIALDTIMASPKPSLCVYTTWPYGFVNACIALECQELEARTL